MDDNTRKKTSLGENIKHVPNDGHLNNQIGLLYSNGMVLNSNGIIISTDAYLNAVTPHSFNSFEAGISQLGIRTPIYAFDFDEQSITSSHIQIENSPETDQQKIGDDQEPSGKFYLPF